jgi:Skp family chaperone for outer membrane proteins
MAVELVARVEEARAKCQDVCNRSQARLERLQEEADAKIEALQDQAAEMQADKAKVEQRIAEIGADYDRRAAQLQQARELTEDALAA